ncbi:MAG: undecaprenyl-diphosphate phosphatase [Pseudomonadales bacterium]|nr:undecaprenyl-diphosphate phosphatase [Pseudomonadales bacterium]
MDWLHITILALVQGVTEFLPISSSAHLILIPLLTTWEDQGLAFDVALHAGTLLAVLWYFRAEVLHMTRDWVFSFSGVHTAESRLAWAVIVGTIPVGIAGYFLEPFIATNLRSPLFMAFGLIFFGLLLAWADRGQPGTGSEYTLSWKGIVFIGCAQALALFPGTSRSGITMTAALMLGLGREAATRFSFLLSIPTILAASLLESMTVSNQGIDTNWTAMLAGLILAGFSAYLCIYFFLAFIQRIGMLPFVIYRLILGLILLALFL